MSRVQALQEPEIAAALAEPGDLWIFAYGSLMWDPGFAAAQASPAMLYAFHRRFCVYSHRYRGTPERPGLVLGLDRGGSCRGVAYRVAHPDAEAALVYLWEREMNGGVYHMKRVSVRLHERSAKPRSVNARTFVVDRCHKGYTGELGVEETARLILQGLGARGPCIHYLENTVRRLEQLGLVDGPLHRLAERVKALAAREPPCP